MRGGIGGSRRPWAEPRAPTQVLVASRPPSHGETGRDIARFCRVPAWTLVGEPVPPVTRHGDAGRDRRAPTSVAPTPMCGAVLLPSRPPLRAEIRPIPRATARVAPAATHLRGT